MIEMFLESEAHCIMLYLFHYHIVEAKTCMIFFFLFHLDSTESKIRAIEAKLTAMEETKKDFGLSELPAAPPGTNRYSIVNKAQTNSANNKQSNRGSYSRRRPYVPSGHRGRRR